MGVMGTSIFACVVLVSSLCPQATAVQQANGYNCQGKINDFYQDPASCSSFYICASQQAFKVDCARGLLFNPSAKHCDWASNVNCGYNTQPPALATSRPYVPVVTARPYVPPVTTAPLNYTPYQPATQGPYRPATNAPYNPVTNAPSTQAFKCAAGQSGIFPHPSDCRKYIQCSSGVQFTMTCPNNLMFNPNMGSCDFAVNVPQCLAG